MEHDETRWARWARKACTVWLWVLLMAATILLGDFLLSLAKPGGSPFFLSSTMKIGDTVVDLKSVHDPAVLKSLSLAFLFASGVFFAGATIILLRLRRLLDAAQTGDAFTNEAVGDLVVIGNLLLAGAVAVPLLSNVLSGVLSSLVPEANTNFQLTPEFTLLLCGFVVRALGVVFAHGVRLQSEAEFTV